jgi:hypothetical protein
MQTEQTGIPVGLNVLDAQLLDVIILNDIQTSFFTAVLRTTCAESGYTIHVYTPEQWIEQMAVNAKSYQLRNSAWIRCGVQGDEFHVAVNQVCDEGHVARQAVKAGDEKHGAAPAAFSYGRKQLGPIGVLFAALHFDVFRQQHPPRAHVGRDRFPLCLHAEAGDALLVRAHSEVGIKVNHVKPIQCCCEAYKRRNLKARLEGRKGGRIMGVPTSARKVHRKKAVCAKRHYNNRLQ